MIIDGFGVQHPTENDPVTTDNLLHIATCAKCEGTFEAGAVTYAKTLQQVLERTAAALSERQDNG